MPRLRSLAGVAMFALPAASLASLRPDPVPVPAQQTGQQIFESVCAQCHSVQPPAKLAPPMSHVARHYLQEIPDRDQAIARVTAWIREPAADRSLLPAHAIETWGLMPPPGLDPDQARSVAGFVLTLADSARGGEMAGQGGGMMRHGMMAGDSAMAGQGGMGRGIGMHHDSAAGMGGMGMGMGRGMMMHRDSAGMMGGTGMGRGMMMHRDSAGTMGGMGMGRGTMRRDTTDTTAMPRRRRGG